MESFTELINIRKSIRSYSAKPVESWKVDALIEAVRLAPSASNSQPWKLIIIDDPNLKKTVAEATWSTLVSFNKFSLQAPLIGVLTIEKPKIITQIGATLKDREFSLIDIGIAASHFCLQAADLGLGTCMIGWFDEKVIQDLLNIPQKTRIGLLITAGYESNSPPKKRLRKRRDQMSSFNSYR